MADILVILRAHAALHGAAGAPAAALAAEIAAQREGGARLGEMALFALVRKCSAAMGGQRALARAIGVSDSQVSDMRWRRRPPERLLEAFGLKPVTVFAFVRNAGVAAAEPAVAPVAADAPHGPGPRDFEAILARVAATKAATRAAPAGQVVA